MRNSKGFTLIELLIVAAILSIMVLVALVIVDPVAQFEKASDARRKSDLQQLQRAMEAFYEDHGFYPCSSANTYRIIDSGVRDDPCEGEGLAFNGSSSWQPYMKLLPADPRSEKSYKYYSPDGQTYYLYASLDRGEKDQNVCNPGYNDACSSITESGLDIKCSSWSVGGGYSNSSVCNYGISSPNTHP